MNKSYDVVVIGAGIIGSSTALALSRHGFKVAVVDMKAGAGQGTTTYSSGILRSFYSIVDSVKLSYDGFNYFKNWRDFLQLSVSEPIANIRCPGGLFLKTPNTDKFLSISLPLLDTVGIKYEHWDVKTCRENLEKPFGMNVTDVFVPKRSTDETFGIREENQTVSGAVFVPDTAYVSDPQLATENVAKAATNNGVKFLFNSKVVKLAFNTLNSNKVSFVNSNSPNSEVQTIETKAVVNCAGAFSNHLNNLAFTGSNKVSDFKITFRNMRQEVAIVPFNTQASNMKSSRIDLSRLPITFDFDTGIYFRSEYSNSLLVGGIEASVDIPYSTFLSNEQNPETELNTSLSEDNSEYSLRLSLRFPDINLPSSRETKGVVSTYDITEDWTPVYDKTNIEGYFVAIGTSGNQFKNCGPVGELMSQIVKTSLNKEKELHKFELKYVTKKNKQEKESIDTNTFGRLRELNNSSASVMG